MGFAEDVEYRRIYREAVVVIDCFLGDAGNEVVILRQIICEVGTGASIMSISGGSHTLV